MWMFNTRDKVLMCSITQSRTDLLQRSFCTKYRENSTGTWRMHCKVPRMTDDIYRVSSSPTFSYFYSGINNWNVEKEALLKLEEIQYG